MVFVVCLLFVFVVCSCFFGFCGFLMFLFVCLKLHELTVYAVMFLFYWTLFIDSGVTCVLYMLLW